MPCFFRHGYPGMNAAMQAGGVVRVRIRGIYATALTRLIIDAGFQVVQPSRVIADRFNLPQLTLPADVTIKNIDSEPSELLVVGYEWAVDRVLEKLRELLPYSFYWRSSLSLHATVKARIRGLSGDMCIAEVSGVEAELLVGREECEPGKEVVASVVRPGVKPGERPRLAPGARVIGDYAILMESERPRATVSEHVRNPEKRAKLVALASEYTERGLSVHWRSSSQHADPQVLTQHLRELYNSLLEVKERAEKGGPGVYSIGEAVVLVRLSSVDKAVLDRIRDTVVPTIELHHSVKSLAPGFSAVVDYAEKLKARGVDSGLLSEALLEMIGESLVSSRSVKLVHVKPDGTVVELSRGEVKNAYMDQGRLIVVVERRVRSHGVYDGLGVEKEPGDRIVTEIDTSSWLIKHTYYSRSGEVKGVYINVNTPPEVSEDSIVYLDLEVDVVRRPGEKPRIIDEEELRKALEAGIITEKLYREAMEKARKALGS